MAELRLAGRNGNLLCILTEDAMNHGRLGAVVLLSACSMGVDVIHGRWFDLSIGERGPHGTLGAFSGRHDEMVSIGTHPDSDQLGIDSGSALLRMVQRFEYER